MYISRGMQVRSWDWMGAPKSIAGGFCKKLGGTHTHTHTLQLLSAAWHRTSKTSWLARQLNEGRSDHWWMQCEYVETTSSLVHQIQSFFFWKITSTLSLHPFGHMVLVTALPSMRSPNNMATSCSVIVISPAGRWTILISRICLLTTKMFVTSTMLTHGWVGNPKEDPLKITL